jgi:serine/threonine-protein kinase HipA
MRLRVVLGPHTIGWLDGIPGHVTRFQFASSYLRIPARPVLGRWYEDHLAADFVETSSTGLPAFFQNYLPEPGSSLRSLLAARANVRPTRELELLAALGDDLPGAVVVRPVSGDDQQDDEGEVDALPVRDVVPSGPLRFSLAGMQLKFSIVRDAKLTLPVTGVGGRFILKLPHNELRGVPANEMATMTWAKAAGIETPDVQLVKWPAVENLPGDLTFDEDDALLVERYDRPADGGPRIHQEDFAQVFGVRAEDKYGAFAQVTYDRLGKVVATVCGASDFQEFVRRLVFCVLSGNPDAHLKNWSLLYSDPRRPRLAPAYDLVSALPYAKVERKLACTLAKEDDAVRIKAWHFGKLASRAGMDANAGVALAQGAAQRIREAWGQVRSIFDAQLASLIDAHMARVDLP